jgi:hypothetical protein
MIEMLQSYLIYLQNTQKKARVDFFQKRKTVMEKSATPKRPTFDYIARKIK